MGLFAKDLTEIHDYCGLAKDYCDFKHFQSYDGWGLGTSWDLGAEDPYTAFGLEETLSDLYLFACVENYSCVGTFTWQANSTPPFGGNNVIGTEILLGHYNSISESLPTGGIVDHDDSFMYEHNYGFDSYFAFSLTGETSSNYDRFPVSSQTTFFRFLNTDQSKKFQVGDTLSVWTTSNYNWSENKRSEIVLEGSSALVPFAAAVLVVISLV
jgi:hypothetical protein